MGKGKERIMKDTVEDMNGYRVSVKVRDGLGFFGGDVTAQIIQTSPYTKYDDRIMTLNKQDAIALAASIIDYYAPRYEGEEAA